MTYFTPRAVLIAASAAVLAACASTPQFPLNEGEEQGTGLQIGKPAYKTRMRDTLPVADEADQGFDAREARIETVSYDDQGEPQPAPAQPPSSVQGSELPPMGPAPLNRDPPPPAQDEPPVQDAAAPEPEVSAYVPPPSAPPPKPRTETRTTTSIGGPVVSVGGKPVVYTVKSGQGLDAVARELGTTRAQLAKDNDLKEPYRLKPGQKLKGPASKGKAYVVQSGDTLYGIARRFNVSAAALAEENDFKVGAAIRPGQKLALPTGFKDSGPVKRTVTVTLDPEPAPPPVARPRPPVVVASRPPEPVAPPVIAPPIGRPPPADVRPPPVSAPVTKPPVSKPVSAPPTVAPVTKPPVAKPPVVKPPVTKPPVVASRPPEPKIAPPGTVSRPPPTSGPPPQVLDDKPPVLTDADYTKLGMGRFQWPVRGAVVSGFGPKGPSQRNDGVDIGAAVGTPVRAAADGTVVYAGGDVPGFGVTVLIQHADGWVTVYANLQRAEVRMQQRVTQGQQIGLVGTSGNAPRPQLHFEVRYSPSPKFKAKAIDPTLVLPR